MIQTSSVKLERSLEGNPLLGSRRLRVGSLSSVQSIDIGCMMLGVVKGHDLLIDEGFKSIVGVGKGWEYVGHGATMVVMVVGREKEGRIQTT